MYQGYALAGLLLGIGIILMIAEGLLPTHGLLGIVGGCAALAAIFVASRENAWNGQRAKGGMCASRAAVAGGNTGATSGGGAAHPASINASSSASCRITA